MDPVKRDGEPRQPHWITPARCRRVATECVGHQQDGDHHNGPAYPNEGPNGVEPVCLHGAVLLLVGVEAFVASNEYSAELDILIFRRCPQCIQVTLRAQFLRNYTSTMELSLDTGRELPHYAELDITTWICRRRSISRSRQRRRPHFFAAVDSWWNIASHLPPRFTHVVVAYTVSGTGCPWNVPFWLRV